MGLLPPVAMVVFGSGFCWGFFLALGRLARQRVDAGQVITPQIVFGCFGMLVLISLTFYGIAELLTVLGFIKGSLVTMLSLFVSVVIGRIFARLVYKTWIE